MIVFGRGAGGSRMGCLGCMPLLLIALAVTLLVLVLSGGQCVFFVFP